MFVRIFFVGRIPPSKFLNPFEWWKFKFFQIHQSVLVSTLNAIYTINPNYGNLTIGDGNATHLGEVNFWFSRKISAFSVSVKVWDLKANFLLKNLNSRSLTWLSLTKEKQFLNQFQVHVARKHFWTWNACWESPWGWDRKIELKILFPPLGFVR